MHSCVTWCTCKQRRRYMGYKFQKTEDKETHRYSVILPDSLHDMIMKDAHDKGQSFSEWIRRAAKNQIEIERSKNMPMRDPHFDYDKEQKRIEKTIKRKKKKKEIKSFKKKDFE